jgi:aconitate hydratase
LLRSAGLSLIGLRFATGSERAPVAVIGGEELRSVVRELLHWLPLSRRATASLARIHRANLINFGILPLVFKNVADYDLLKQDDKLIFRDLRKLVASGQEEIPLTVNGRTIITLLDASERERKELLAGGTLNVKKGL